jgi:hypothetical protein
MQVFRLGDRDDGVAEGRRILAILGLLDNTDPSSGDLFTAPPKQPSARSSSAGD